MKRSKPRREIATPLATIRKRTGQSWGEHCAGVLPKAPQGSFARAFAMSGWGRMQRPDLRKRPYVIVSGPDGRRVGRSSFKDAPDALAVKLAVRRASLEDDGPTLPVEGWWVNLATLGEGGRIVVDEPTAWKRHGTGRIK